MGEGTDCRAEVHHTKVEAAVISRRAEVPGMWGGCQPW